MKWQFNLVQINVSWYMGVRALVGPNFNIYYNEEIKKKTSLSNQMWICKLYHQCDVQFQAYTNEDTRVYGICSLWVQAYINEGTRHYGMICSLWVQIYHLIDSNRENVKKIMFLRISFGNTIVNGMNHYLYYADSYMHQYRPKE